jgi:hypothetical protein
MSARLCAVAAASLALVPGSSAAVAPPDLVAKVGPRATISLRLGDGTRVVRLKAGRYTIGVADRSRHDDFHLRGSVDRKTGIAFVGTTTWTVRLRKGTYRYLSDAHPRTLRGSFQVY